MAASSKPWPKPLTTCCTCTVPLARKIKSSTTSPSSFRLRPSAVYSGRGFSRMVTEVVPLTASVFFLGASTARVLIAKAGGLHRAFAAAATRGRICDAISEAGAGYRAANTFVTAGAIAVAGTARKRGRTLAVDVGGFIGIAVARHAIGIAEAAGLNFVQRGNDRGGSRAATAQNVGLHFIARALGLSWKWCQFLRLPKPASGPEP